MNLRSSGMNCGHSGMTRLLVHKVPYFRELIIASFCCDNCGERNNDVTFGGEIQVRTYVLLHHYHLITLSLKTPCTHILMRNYY